MRRFLSSLAAALCTLAVVSTAAQARTFEEIKQSGKIVVATEGQFPPFNYFVGTKLTGFEVELMELVAKRMGVSLEWKALGFDALLTGLRQDRWDLVIASHGITEERAKAVTFTEPHYCSGGVIVSSNPALRRGQDLAGKVVSVQTGSTYFENVRKLPGLKEVKNFPQDVDARTALLTGRVDAWVTDRFVALTALRANPNSGVRQQGMLFLERIAAAVAKGNDSVSTAYNKALAQVFASGEYEALSKRYFDQDIRCQ